MRKIFILLGLVLLGMAVAVLFKKPPTVSGQLQKELNDQHLAIDGKIPSWLSGTLVRNGPVYVTVNGKTNAHWFDGLAMLHGFSFYEGKVLYTNRFLRTAAYKTVFEKGSLNYNGFATDPCRSLFKRFFTLFIPKSTLELHNANVNVALLADHYVALTEIPLPVRFDPQTLETLGVLDYQDSLPHEKCWESAHPHHDGARKESLNYLVEYGPMSHYTLYRLADGSDQREIISRIPVQEPAYMHSFSVTENYVIFTEFPFVVKPFDLLSKNQPFIKNFSWEPARGTQFIVVNRHNGELVGKYKTKSFFAFHHANAFEKEDNLILDIVCYKDPSVVIEIANPSEKAPEEKVNDESLERFTLSLKSGEFSSEIIFKQSIEFPRINEKFDGHPYRYVYLSDPSESNEEERRALYKVDAETKKIVEWRESRCSPGEPIFVAAPNAKEEDEGVVLAVVLDLNHQTSFLLVLDGKSFQEIGRAEVSHPIPAGLHGQFFQKH